MKRGWLLLSVPLALGLAAACGSDAGDGDGGDDGLSLDPGREVDGCFDCTDDEYCMLVVRGGEDLYFCAPTPDCGLGCDCLIPDSEERHVECYSSCQEDSGMVYCARE